MSIAGTEPQPTARAAILAFLVAWRWQNAVLTIAIGMGALWLFAAIWPIPPTPTIVPIGDEVLA